MFFLSFLLMLAAGFVAWGARSVPAGQQWLIRCFNKRLPYRITEGLGWLPRWPAWLFDYEPYDIREDEFHILGDHLPDGHKRETIMTTNGVEVVVRGVVGYYTIARRDPNGKRSWLRFLGWESGQSLLAYSQVRDQDVVNRIPPLIRSNLRALVPTFSVEELLGLSIDALGMQLADRNAIATSRGTLQEMLTEVARSQALTWGIEVTRITVGDIDPNDDMKRLMQLKAKAKLEAQAAVTATEAYTERAKVVLRAGSAEAPTLEQVQTVVFRLMELDNQRIAAEQGGNVSRFVQNLVDVTTRTAANG